MPVGAEGVYPGRGCPMERARERQKAPSPVDRLAQGVELILQNEVKPRCGHFASRLSALTFLLACLLLANHWSKSFQHRPFSALTSLLLKKPVWFSA